MGWRFPSINDIYLTTAVCRFLLASLNIEAILEEVTIGQRRKKLELMVGGSGLSDAYTATITRMKAQKGSRPRLGLQALRWVLFSQRPLQAEELCHALGVEIGSAELDPEDIPSLPTVLASCLGLLTVEKFSSKVRLVHFTLQEHLLGDPTLLQNSHSMIAEVCLTYLNFRSVRDLSPTLDSAPSTMPLLEYSSFYWGQHAKREMTEEIKILGRKFLDICSKHISIRLLELSSDRGRRYCPYINGKGRLTGFIGLDRVTFFGIWDAIAAISETDGGDVNIADWMGSTALARAVVGGQEAVVKMLLDRKDIDPNHGNIGNGWTPLLLAAMAGREGVVKMLLERDDVKPDRSDTQYGQTPLSWAAENGHEGIVKMLLARPDVSPDQPDTKDGLTPLAWAAKNGHEGVVQILLGREEVNPDRPDTKCGLTPLSWAAQKGHEGVVKMLLERKDVNPNRPDTEYGQTPLSWAAKNGHEGVVKMLLDQEDVNPNQGNIRDGWAPLLSAAVAGREGVVKLLLGRKDVNPDQPDTQYGQTPLWWAAENGHEEVVKMLLGRPDVNPDQPDIQYGQTPLSRAAMKGHEGVVKLLLEHRGVRPVMKDNSHQSPQSLALSVGDGGLARIPQERDNPDSHRANHGGQAPAPPSPGPANEFEADAGSGSLDTKIDVTEFNGQPPSPPAADAARARLPERPDPISKSSDHGLSTRLSLWARFISTPLRKLFRRRRKT